jgi:hypothetical protein
MTHVWMLAIIPCLDKVCTPLDIGLPPPALRVSARYSAFNEPIAACSLVSEILERMNG